MEALNYLIDRENRANSGEGDSEDDGSEEDYEENGGSTNGRRKTNEQIVAMLSDIDLNDDFLKAK